MMFTLNTLVYVTILFTCISVIYNRITTIPHQYITETDVFIVTDLSLVGVNFPFSVNFMPDTSLISP